MGTLLRACDLDLTFHLSVVTFTYKILVQLYLSNCKVKKSILGRDSGSAV